MHPEWMCRRTVPCIDARRRTSTQRTVSRAISLSAISWDVLYADNYLYEKLFSYRPSSKAYCRRSVVWPTVSLNKLNYNWPCRSRRVFTSVNLCVLTWTGTGHTAAEIQNSPGQIRGQVIFFFQSITLDHISWCRPIALSFHILTRWHKDKRHCSAFSNFSL